MQDPKQGSMVSNESAEHRIVLGCLQLAQDPIFGRLLDDGGGSEAK